MRLSAELTCEYEQPRLRIEHREYEAPADLSDLCEGAVGDAGALYGPAVSR